MNLLNSFFVGILLAACTCSLSYGSPVLPTQLAKEGAAASVAAVKEDTSPAAVPSIINEEGPLELEESQPVPNIVVPIPEDELETDLSAAEEVQSETGRRVARGYGGYGGYGGGYGTYYPASYGKYYYPRYYGGYGGYGGYGNYRRYRPYYQGYQPHYYKKW